MLRNCQCNVFIIYIFHKFLDSTTVLFYQILAELAVVRLLVNVTVTTGTLDKTLHV